MVPASAVGISESPPLVIAVSGGGWEEDEAMNRRGESAVGKFLHCFLSFLFSFSSKQHNTKKRTLLSPLISLSFCKTEVLNERKLIMGADG